MNNMKKENFYQVYFLDSDSDNSLSDNSEDDEKLQTKFETLDQLFNNLYDKNNHLIFSTDKLREDATNKLTNNISYETDVININIWNNCYICDIEIPIEILKEKATIKYCSRCLDHILYDIPFIECSFCGEYEHDDVSLIKKYDNIFICNNCMLLYPNKDIIIKDNNECPICYDLIKTLKLPNCEHYLCVNCFQKLYYGKDLIKTKYNPRIKISKPKFPCDIKKIREYQDWIEENEEIYYSNNKKLWNKICKKRPQWMNTEEFIEYEKKNKIYIKLEEENEEDIKIIMARDEIFNKSKCPLCRK